MEAVADKSTEPRDDLDPVDRRAPLVEGGTDFHAITEAVRKTVWNRHANGGQLRDLDPK